MKKLGALSMAAFYLVLSTGMFVCLVHCAAWGFSKQPAMHMAHAMGMHAGKQTKPDCCKTHGSFQIKQNIKTGFQFDALNIVADLPVIIPSFLDRHVIRLSYSVLKSDKAPPGKAGKLIALQSHSLLI
ncbi:hypothetical protein [Mucilaginibacter segetis]|uniref:Uncharacterized protein n=1 Tax=Mucilaginibacter segetis TaxID=2793071 RepID=A0A934UNN1_9SPHI|nr:hypothetical protein [Mucilaginibacter segetis]MBK0380589.1 hypothetical protein [Mucilaginibacter segetis]